MPLRLALTLAFASLGAVGCTTYDTRYRYTPKPLDALVIEDAETPPHARALISILGVRRAEPASVDLRIRIENLGTEALSFDAESAVLITADLMEFDPPKVEGTASVLEVPPGSQRTMALSFPFASQTSPSDYDLDGLNLKWTLSLGEKNLTQSSTFQRLEPELTYYEPAYFPHHYHFGFGYGRRCY